MSRTSARNTAGAVCAVALVSACQGVLNPRPDDPGIRAEPPNVTGFGGAHPGAGGANGASGAGPIFGSSTGGGAPTSIPPAPPVSDASIGNGGNTSDGLDGAAATDAARDAGDARADRHESATGED